MRSLSAACAEIDSPPRRGFDSSVVQPDLLDDRVLAYMPKVASCSRMSVRGGSCNRPSHRLRLAAYEGVASSPRASSIGVPRSADRARRSRPELARDRPLRQHSSVDEDAWVERIMQAARDESPLALDFDQGSFPAPTGSSTRSDIPATAIRRALLSEEWRPGPPGLVISAARITGDLDLSHVYEPRRLVFEGCTFQGSILADACTLGQLHLHRCQIESLSLDGATISGGLYLNRTVVSGSLSAIGAAINGQLAMAGASFTTTDVDAVVLDGAKIGGGWYCNDLRVTGVIRAQGVIIDGPLQMTGAKLLSDSGDSLLAERIQVHGGWLGRGLTSRGMINLHSAVFDGPIILTDAHLDAGAEEALVLNDARIGGDALLDSMTIKGSLLAVGARLSGRLIMRGTQLDNPGTVAAALSEMRIERGWDCGGGFACLGAFLAPNAVIDGDLDMRQATFLNPPGLALDVSGTQIRGDWLCSEHFHSEGKVRGLRMRVGGQISMNGATLLCEGSEALNLDRAKIQGGWFCDEGFSSHGEVRALGVEVGGQFALFGAKLSNSHGHSLSLDGGHLGAWFCSEGFCSEGEVRAIGVVVEGPVTMNGAIFSNELGPSLSVDRARIEGDWMCIESFSSSGLISAEGIRVFGRVVIRDAILSGEPVALNLLSSTVGMLDFDPTVITGLTDLRLSTIGSLITHSKEPLSLAMEGWRVQDIMGAMQTRRLAIAWLEAAPSFTPQAWHEIADVYERHGRTGDATRLRWQAARRATRGMSPASKLLRWLYAGFAGYGYYPLLASAWLSVATTISILLASCNFRSFVALDPSPALPPFDPVLYGIANVLPAASMPGVDSWVSHDPHLMFFLLALRIFGWLQIATLLAGLTGLLRRG